MAKTDSNTEKKQRRNTIGLKPFVKGDPRINRNGRPKSFDALREMAIQIMNTPVSVVAKEMGVTVKSEYEKLDCAGYLLRKWIFSAEPTLQKGAMEIAFGKVPDKLEMSGQINITFVENLK